MPHKDKAEKAAYKKKWYAENKETSLAYNRQWKADNPEKEAIYNKRKYAKKTAENPYWDRNKRYNVDFEDMLASQGGKCLICETTEPKGTADGWAVDHDHNCCKGNKSCGECVRGILCQTCNTGLGHFKDNLEFLENAQHYLLKGTDVIGIGNL
jgi:hypothetical protein